MVQSVFMSADVFDQEGFVRFLETLTADDCHRYELIGGHIHMTPPDGWPNSKIAFHASRILFNFAEESGLGVVTGSNTGFELPSGDTVGPDAAFLLNERAQALKNTDHSFVRAVPDLVVEVLSKSTRRHDLGDKKGIYESNGVREYWIVDHPHREVTRYSLVDGRFDNGTLFAAADTFESRLLEGLRFPVEALFDL